MVAAWIVHLYTASGAFLAFLSLASLYNEHYRETFFWLAVAVVVDATDGILAREADVAGHLPGFNGSKLDDIVDYVTYVFVPVVILWFDFLVPETWAYGVIAAMLLSSAIGFNRANAKTDDHYFTGFPSYWNIVVFYLFIADWNPAINAMIIYVLAALVVVPIRYVYPSRTRTLRPLTIALGLAWGVLMAVMIWRMPQVNRTMLWVSLAFPAYYFVLSLVLEFRRRVH